ncbi:MAG TPA: GNAT family N-acetyltransferase [Actinomycetota bacterium]|jgi:predicted acetyltransferase|nr:GNAT family N-acetyltransferase [Actinomycetota bacterium]
MDIEIRSITPEEFEPYYRALEDAFSGVMRPDEVENERTLTEFDRCLVAIEDGQFVGGASAASMRLGVPGGIDVPVAGITGVGVKPTHRRRGISTALMRRQLDDVRGRGEALAALYASEAGIYGRFGFGLATFTGSIEIEVGRSAFVRGYRPSGRVRLLAREDALPLFRIVYDRARPLRPGAPDLDDRWFQWLFFVGKRDEDQPPFWAVHESDEGEPDACVVYKVKHEWPGSVPKLELSVEFLIAATPQAHADIWRYVFDIDLVHHVKGWNRPVDEPLLHLLREPRRLGLTVEDGMWIRLVDVPAALGARGYAGDGRAVFEVRDPFCPWNEDRHELVVEAGRAACGPTDDAPDIACSVNDLGAVYLGGSTFGQLARAGLVTEARPGGLMNVDGLFGCGVSPWSPVHF